jgi:hypothetical protein
MRLASSISFVLIGLLAACGGSDDLADSIADELGSNGESPDTANTQAEADSVEAGSSSAESSATDSSASDTSVDSTASDTTGSSTDADSSSSGPSDGMEAPMDGPSTHDSTATDGVIETDDGAIGGECTTACDCMQGLGCSDNFMCAPVPDNAYCCEKAGCPSGADCQFSDGSFGVCAG